MIAPTDAAANFLVNARRTLTPGARIPEACRPADAAAAIAIQRRVTELLALPIGGWKCSVPTAQRPVIHAPIYATTIAVGSPCPIIPVGGVARIEPEVAFVIGRDLPPRDRPYTEEEIRAAIREPRLVLELIGTRYADPTAASFPELLADGIANQGLYVGPAVPDALDRPLDVIPIAIVAEGQDTHAVSGKHPDGHPLLPLLWLANYLAQHDAGLRAGQIVTTGSYCGVVDVPLATPLTVRFGDLGKFEVRFTAA